MTKRNGLHSEEDLATWRRYDEDAISSLLKKIEELDSEESYLVPRLTSIRAEREKTIGWISILKGEEPVEIPKFLLEQDERTNSNTASDESGGEEEVACGRARVTDLDGCPSQRKAMYVIGKLNDGIIELNDAAALVVAAGMSKTDDRTVSASLHNFMSTCDDFEWIGPSRFRLSPDDDPEPTTGDEMAQAARHA